MTKFPTVKEVIEVDLKSHVFHFRRLTWRDSLRKPRTRVEALATALLDVSGTALSHEDALRVITTLPIPIQERVYTIYIGSQDARRLAITEAPWSAPDAIEFQDQVNLEEAKKEDAVSEALVNRFGQDAIDEEQALSNKIVQQSGFRGAILQTKAAESELADE